MSGVRAVLRVVLMALAQADECQRYRKVLLTRLLCGAAVLAAWRRCASRASAGSERVRIVPMRASCSSGLKSRGFLRMAASEYGAQRLLKIRTAFGFRKQAPLVAAQSKLQISFPPVGFFSCTECEDGGGRQPRQPVNVAGKVACERGGKSGETVLSKLQPRLCSTDLWRVVL